MKLILALDYADIKPASALVEQLNPSQCALKVGLEMYTRFGPAWVEQLSQRGFKVFLDLKFHDIPHTVAQACRAAADLGVWMINVHAMGGLKMLEAAQEALSHCQNPPLLIAVTALTSLSDVDIQSLGFAFSLEEMVIRLAKIAHGAGLDGVVCAASMASIIKSFVSENWITVTPGIRWPGDDSHDQQQVMTPDLAIKSKSDYWVVGRSITQAANPIERLHAILELMP